MTILLRSTKGQVLILLAAALAGLIGVAMLAIDVGTAYVVKTKLNAAVDAASIAGGKAVSQGAAAAQIAAANFFNVNFPTGTLGTTSVEPTIAVTPNADNSWTVNVAATAIAPTYFAKAFGFDNFTLGASATSKVLTLDLVMVMDCSGSIGSALPLLQAAAVNFINRFDAVTDRVGLIHFASGAVTDVAVTATRGFDRTALTRMINGFSVGGATTSEEALRLAQVQLDSIPVNSRSTLRAIVFFTDGAPNGVAGNFINGAAAVQGDLYSETTDGGAPDRIYSMNRQEQQLPGTYDSIALLPATDWSGQVNLASYNNMRSLPVNAVNTRCNVNMAARNMLENVANAARSESATPIHIFTIGLGNAMTIPEITFCGYGNNELGANILQRLANVPTSDTYNRNQPTGVYAYAQDPTQLNAAFSQVATAILRLSK